MRSLVEEEEHRAGDPHQGDLGSRFERCAPGIGEATVPLLGMDDPHLIAGGARPRPAAHLLGRPYDAPEEPRLVLGREADPQEHDRTPEVTGQHHVQRDSGQEQDRVVGILRTCGQDLPRFPRDDLRDGWLPPEGTAP